MVVYFAHLRFNFLSQQLKGWLVYVILSAGCLIFIYFHIACKNNRQARVHWIFSALMNYSVLNQTKSGVITKFSPLRPRDSISRSANSD